MLGFHVELGKHRVMIAKVSSANTSLQNQFALF